MNDQLRPLRVLHGHVDAGMLRLRDAQIYSVRFQRDPMPIDHHRAVLLVLPGPPGADTLLELVGRIALENEQLKMRVTQLEEECMQMAGDLVTSMDDPNYESRKDGDMDGVDDPMDDNGHE